MGRSWLFMNCICKIFKWYINPVCRQSRGCLPLSFRRCRRPLSARPSNRRPSGCLRPMNQSFTFPFEGSGEIWKVLDICARKYIPSKLKSAHEQIIITICSNLLPLWFTAFVSSPRDSASSARSKRGVANNTLLLNAGGTWGRGGQEVVSNLLKMATLAS